MIRFPKYNLVFKESIVSKDNDIKECLVTCTLISIKELKSIYDSIFVMEKLFINSVR